MFFCPHGLTKTACSLHARRGAPASRTQESTEAGLQPLPPPRFPMLAFSGDAGKVIGTCLWWHTPLCPPPLCHTKSERVRGHHAVTVAKARFSRARAFDGASLTLPDTVYRCRGWVSAGTPRCAQQEKVGVPAGEAMLGPALTLAFLRAQGPGQDRDCSNSCHKLLVAT